MRKLPKYWMELLNLVEGVFQPIFENPEIEDIWPDKKLVWLKTAQEMINELLPIVKRKKLNQGIKYKSLLKRG